LTEFSIDDAALPDVCIRQGRFPNRLAALDGGMRAWRDAGYALEK
jgi:hypothetical protein